VLRRRTVRRLEVRPDRVVLDGELCARAVVGADGANGVVRRQLGHPRQPDTAMAVAVRGYAPAPPGEPEQRIVMTRQDWPAYAWSFAAGDGTANVGFGMLLPSLRAELGRHLRHTTLLARLTARPSVVDLGVAAAARSPRALEALVELGLGRGLITPPLVTAMARRLVGA